MGSTCSLDRVTGVREMLLINICEICMDSTYLWREVYKNACHSAFALSTSSLYLRCLNSVNVPQICLFSPLYPKPLAWCQLSFEKLFKRFILFCVYECFAHMPVCVPWACMIPTEPKHDAHRDQKGCLSPQNWT